MLDWPEPKNVTELRGFLGLTGYYKRFVEGYGKVARPLTELLKKNGFEWNEGAAKAFNQLKRSVTSLPVLVLPDFTKPFVIEMDASGARMGAVLSQEGRPIAFISQGFSDKGRSKSVYERELIAIVFAVTKWKHYLTGRKFIIKTDQKSLKYLLDQKTVTGDQLRWASKLLGLDYIIEYKPGVENKVADALSRRPVEGVMELMVTAPSSLNVEELYAQLQTDVACAELMAQLKEGKCTKAGYALK